MLGWLEYNVKRALGIEVSDDEEIRMRKEQVKETINVLYDYQAFQKDGYKSYARKTTCPERLNSAVCG